MSAATLTHGPRLPLWTRGDLNAFFGLGHQHARQRPRDRGAHDGRDQPLRPRRLPGDPAGARRRAARRQPLLLLAGASPRHQGGARRRHRDAVRAERPAHVHRDVRDHAADVPADEGPDRGLDGRPRMGLHHRRDHPHRRLRGPGDPALHAPRGAARHARRHLADLHLDAARRADVGGDVDRAARARDHHHRLHRERAAAGQFPGRPRGAARRHDGRLDRRLHVGRQRHPVGRADRRRSAVAEPRPARRRPVGHLAAARHRHPARHLQLHRGDEQRGERRGGGRQVQPAQRAPRRRHRRDRRLRASAARSRPPSMSGTRAGRPPADASPTRWPPAW